MPPKKKKTRASPASGKKEDSLRDVLSLYSHIADIKKQLLDVANSRETNNDRITDLEVHVNLLTRLLMALCIEKLGMGIGVLKRLVKRIEREAVRDSQILELELLYKLSPDLNKKKFSFDAESEEDPWDKIS
ncbi:MAG: hypothetical protein BWY42_00271 [Candidatus Omnitrophica bacterium ADurb.Bin277]|nr:MAG: hypothetical protein BWY42_00271 [Candidatus Omnitrophica bacterium ADurb.Bin277]